jgi:UDP-GlcNAc:undecaprenyl-phosphate GlcNAc-1-phosphate transferase
MISLISLISAFAIVVILTPIIRRYALAWKLGDKPNGRKIHTSTIPHLGGIGIVLGTLGATSACALWIDETGETAALLVRLIVPVTMIVVMGLMDDTKNLKAREKLFVQITSAAILALVGFRFVVGLPLLDQNLAFGILLTTFYLVGMSSAINLVDGMDGVAAGLSAISAASFAVLAAMLGASPILYLSLALTGACVGFLIHNFPPGKIFMGDNGSMFLGITLGIVACSFTVVQPGINTFVAVCLILALPMVDAWLAIARRLARRQPIFRADSQHVHHVVHSFGFTNRQTLLILYFMQSVMAFLGILTMKGLIIALVVGLVLLFATFVTFLRIMLVSPVLATARPKLVHNSIPSLEK